MNAQLTSVVGFTVAGSITYAATPLAIRVAESLGMYDYPREYRKHRAPTPLLGGAAVLAGILAGAVAVGASGNLLVLIGCAVAIWVVGTIDDVRAVAPRWRLLAEAAAATALTAAGLGWSTPAGATPDFLLTVLWVSGLVNAFNLMDNLDGACGTVAAVSALGIGTSAAIHHQAAVAGLAFALSGACLVFLRWNLARPARIFLGDGGSRPIGLLIAGLVMATERNLGTGEASVLAGALMAGVVILDTALVSVSRARRGVTLLTGGRDHLTHRLLLACRSPRRVAAVIAATQGVLCAVAILGDRGGRAVLGVIGLAATALGVVAIAVLDSRRWRPAGIAVADAVDVPPLADAASVSANRQ